MVLESVFPSSPLFPVGFCSICSAQCPSGKGKQVHLFLELAELGREAVNADPRLLELLMGSPHEVAVSLSRLPGIIQLQGAHSIRINRNLEG